jgi:hypothetical protein
MATKTKSSTLKTRERTAEPANKRKPNGERRQLTMAATEREEDEREDEREEDEELPEVLRDEEPIAAADAEPPPPDPEPEAETDQPRRGRGRPKGTGKRTKAIAEPEAQLEARDLFAALCEAGFVIKKLASDFDRSPEQVLSALGQIVGAAADLENPPQYVEDEPA